MSVLVFALAGIIAGLLRGWIAKDRGHRLLVAIEIGLIGGIASWLFGAVGGPIGIVAGSFVGMLAGSALLRSERRDLEPVPQTAG